MSFEEKMKQDLKKDLEIPEIGLIKVVVESKGSEFTCKIADAGIGISETDLPHPPTRKKCLISPFFTASIT